MNAPMNRRASRSPPVRLSGLLRRAASENYLVLVTSALASVLLLGIGLSVTDDTWLALVSGRLVEEGGPPTRDALAIWTSGRDWVDQQWLGQLAFYEIWRAGSFGLLGLVHVAIVTATFVAMLAAARRRGGSPRAVAIIALLAALPIILVTGNIRTQTFAVALFGIVLCLVSEDSRAPSPRVFWTLPLLVLWANVHGSVLIGGGLVALAGAIALVSGARARPRELAHGAALVATVAVALLVTPYGFALFAYFGALLGDAEIALIASDWKPTPLEPVHVPFFLLAGLTLMLIGRHGGRLSTFERITLVLLIAAALLAQRNLAWFALAAVLLVPPLLAREGASPRGPPPIALAATISALAVAGVATAAVAGSTGAAEQIESDYPDGVSAAVAREAARDPSLSVVAGLTYADWLLFRQPQLAGRIAYDIRLELLNADELRRVRQIRDQIGADWPRALGDARLVVLDADVKPSGIRSPAPEVLLREPGARRVYARNGVVVILRPVRPDSADG